MKVLLYSEGGEILKQSGLGQAIEHQKSALTKAGVPFTLDPAEDYDLVHINTWGPRSYAMAKHAHRQGKKVVYHAHSTEEDFRNSYRGANLVSPLFRRWITRCYAQGDAILTPTPYAKGLLEGYGLGNITAVSNGVDTALFCRNAARGKVFRDKYGFGEGDKVVLGIGLYLERKGILDFVDMARRLPEVHFLWLGHADLNLVPAKVRRAVETKLPNLHFPGFVPAEEVRDALNGADPYWFPTLEETEGIPALEACACRQRLLVRDIPVFRDWLEDGVTVYKGKTQAEFEETIRGMLDGTLPDLTEAAYAVAGERSLEEVGAKLAAVYRRVLEEA